MEMLFELLEEGKEFLLSKIEVSRRRELYMVRTGGGGGGSLGGTTSTLQSYFDSDETAFSKVHQLKVPTRKYATLQLSFFEYLGSSVKANIQVTHDSSEELYGQWVSFMCQRWAADKWPNMVRAGQILLVKLHPLGLYVNTTATFQDILTIINFSLVSRRPPMLSKVWQTYKFTTDESYLMNLVQMIQQEVGPEYMWKNCMEM